MSPQLADDAHDLKVVAVFTDDLYVAIPDLCGEEPHGIGEQFAYRDGRFLSELFAPSQRLFHSARDSVEFIFKEIQVAEGALILDARHLSTSTPSVLAEFPGEERAHPWDARVYRDLVS